MHARQPSLATTGDEVRSTRSCVKNVTVIISAIWSSESTNSLRNWTYNSGASVQIAACAT